MKKAKFTSAEIFELFDFATCLAYSNLFSCWLTPWWGSSNAPWVSSFVNTFRYKSPETNYCAKIVVVVLILLRKLAQK